VHVSTVMTRVGRRLVIHGSRVPLQPAMSDEDPDQRQRREGRIPVCCPEAEKAMGELNQGTATEQDDQEPQQRLPRTVAPGPFHVPIMLPGTGWPRHYELSLSLPREASARRRRCALRFHTMFCTARVAQPAKTMPVTFTKSWTALP